METAISLFKQYSGQGMIVSLFILALAYLWFAEKNKNKRRLLVGLPIVLLAVFFCPVLVFFMEKLGEEEVYWRLLWSMPMLTVIAYAAIVLIGRLEGVKRYFAIGGVVFVIMLSGNYLYNNPGFLKAENPEHMPAEVVEICDKVIVEGREVRACFPAEMLMYVPQYTNLVHMPYGRELFLRPNGIVITHELFNLMETENTEAEELSEKLRFYQCHYVILRKDANINGALTEFDWIFYGETDNYRIYLDSTNDPRQF